MVVLTVGFAPHACLTTFQAKWGHTHKVNPSNLCGLKGCYKYMKVKQCYVPNKL